jgi:hypothetical protein
MVGIWYLPQRAFKLRFIYTLCGSISVINTIGTGVAVYDGVQYRGIVEGRKIGSGWTLTLVGTSSKTGEGWYIDALWEQRSHRSPDGRQPGEFPSDFTFVETDEDSER